MISKIRLMGGRSTMLYFSRQIWCAAGVNLTGGRTRDGGSIVGASVFYSGDPATPTPQPKDDVDRLDYELRVWMRFQDTEILSSVNCFGTKHWSYKLPELLSIPLQCVPPPGAGEGAA